MLHTRVLRVVKHICDPFCTMRRVMLIKSLAINIGFPHADRNIQLPPCVNTMLIMKAVMIIRQTPTGVQMNEIDLTDINVMKSPYYYLQPNDYIYVKPLRQKTWGTGQTGIQSIGTIITLLSLATTVYLIIKN